MEGARAIPAQATHILAQTLNADLSQGEALLIGIPLRTETAPLSAPVRFLVMTDLHLSRKPWKIRQALEMGKGYDAVLIAGDIVNDGQPGQLARFWQCVSEKLPDTPVFAVTGNHDYPHHPVPLIPDGVCSYPLLQERLLERGRDLGYAYEQDSCGAYCVSFGPVEVIGLNAATNFRTFRFPDGAQLAWLEEHLKRSTAERHVILCHAPLFAHRAYIRPKDQPYLNRDKELQQILDANSGIVFVSGHTHLSMNNRESCVEQDALGNIYMNAGSVRPTMLKEDEPLQPEEWKSGNVVELLLTQRQTVVTAVSVGAATRFPRGHYCFGFE